MADVLMSIKPVYVDRIFDFSKGWEYRRACPRLEPDDVVVVYASAPVMRIVGQFPVVDVLRGTPASIWRRTHTQAGISEIDFYRYFNGCETASAIRIGVPVRFAKPIDPRERDPKWRPPQSYTYTIPDLGDPFGSSATVCV